MSGVPGLDPSYRELVEWAYNGEMFGVLFLDVLLRADSHPEHRDSLTLLRELEAATMHRLAAHIGEDLDPSEDLVAAATDFARDVASMTWQQFMDATVAIAHEALPHFELLVRRAPPAAAHDMAAVLDHERSLLAFADGDEPKDASTLTPHLDRYPAEPSPPTKDHR
ncbi:hypothetical protein [Rhodococcoides fascians]|uniref:hypothetical protein n=1 Tax=Rhodococcoides fascians TaxID=1828 RepID=UPI001D969FDD|nr:hypothetical protein [Rhodococcus fascians]CAH0291814.1 hypothetical protein SRABI91_04243 [Rhodococcus fascians]